MDFILDFQGFKSEKNEFIVKEICIVSRDEGFYELHLFLPPYPFNTLTENVRKQVIWLEKNYHGLFWNSGVKLYDELQDIFEPVGLKGKVFVKGLEKQKFISQLLSKYPVTVENLEDLGCPALDVLERNASSSILKPCHFNHEGRKHCAYKNCVGILQWLKTEQLLCDTLDNVDLSIKKCYSLGINNLTSADLCLLPKQVILNLDEDIEPILGKLPKKLQTDQDILENLRCTKHFYTKLDDTEFDGPMPKRKNCHFCKYRERDSDVLV